MAKPCALFQLVYFYSDKARCVLKFHKEEQVFFVFHFFDRFIELGKGFHFLLIDLQDVHSGLIPPFSYRSVLDFCDQETFGILGNSPFI